MHLAGHILISAVIVAGATAPAMAQTCESNFKMEGVPLLTALTFRSSQIFPKVNPKRALNQLASAVAAEGLENIRVDRALGAVSAMQDTTGTGRLQTLRVTVRKSGSGSRVDVIFATQPGQVAAESSIRDSLCRIVVAVAE